MEGEVLAIILLAEQERSDLAADLPRIFTKGFRLQAAGPEA
jgi:hypothetical protein